jgi:hypothetical protein
LDTIDGAVVVVAAAGLDEGGTGDAAMLGSSGNNADAALAADTTAGVAEGPIVPGGEDAVNRAGGSAAGYGVLERRTFDAAVGGSNAHTTILGLDARATALAAGTVRTPVGNYAVDGAGISIAVTVLIKVAAGKAAMAGRGSDSAGTALGATTARNGAQGPGAPDG